MIPLRNSLFQSVLLVTLLMIALAFVGVRVVQVQLEARLLDQASAQLSAEMQNLEALYDQRRVIAVRQAIEFRLVQRETTDRLYLLQDRNSTRLAGNLDVWPEQITARDQGFGDGAVVRFSVKGRDSESTHLATARELRGGFKLLAGVSLKPVQDTLDEMLQVFFLFGALLLLAGLVAAFVTAQRGKNRLQRVNQFLDGVAGRNGVDQRLISNDQNQGSEYVQLDRHVNAMLDRIAHLFAAHQRLGNAVAHEMRTPLARIRAKLAKLNLDERAHQELDDEMRSTIRLFDSLLNIAQMDAQSEDSSGLVPIDFSQISADIIELYQPVAEESGRRLQSDIAPNLQILGDLGQMSQLLSNLVENGLKFTKAGDVINVVLQEQEGRVILRVSDTGPGLSDELKDTVFQPFARGKHVDDIPGHGLGLSLIKAIALRHGGILRLPETEKGFALEVDCMQFDETATHRR